MIQLYYAFIYPLLLYGNIAWGNIPAAKLAPITELQKTAIRLAGNIRKYDRTSFFCIKHQLLKLKDLYTLSTTKFMCKFHREYLPPILMRFFSTNEHPYSTRRAITDKPPLYKSAIGNRFIKKTGIQIWHDLTDTIDITRFSEKMIKSLAIKTIISKYTWQISLCPNVHILPVAWLASETVICCKRILAAHTWNWLLSLPGSIPETHLTML